MEFKEKAFNQNAMFESDKDGFIDFGEVSRGLLDKQSQYSIGFLFGDKRYDTPNLGENLRVQGCLTDSYSAKIHKDDLDEFIRRYKDWEKNN